MSAYLTPEQAAEKLPRFNADFIRIQLRKGALEGFKVGGRWFTTEAAIDAMVAAGSNSQRRRKGRAA
ncbi:MAG TPA: hypothetical protein VJ782_01850 [Aeromicrobium sp.]|nr:hypothetical protein [Aeromicrobium sp.]